MGDRVLIQCHNSKTGDFGPVVYGHNSGGDAMAAVARLRARMESRPGDLEYSSARLVQELIGRDTSNLSFGLWNAGALLTAEDSHGDAGVILLDVANGLSAECLGGYLEQGSE